MDIRRNRKRDVRKVGYTAVISEEIAKGLNARTIGQRSPGFQGFVEAVRNGEATPVDEPVPLTSSP